MEEKREHMDEAGSEITSVLFEMAVGYEKRGELYQAIDLYRMLMKEHPETEEANFSKQSLIRIASVYVKQGKNRMAISLYKEVLTEG